MNALNLYYPLVQESIFSVAQILKNDGVTFLTSLKNPSTFCGNEAVRSSAIRIAATVAIIFATCALIFATRALIFATCAVIKVVYKALPDRNAIKQGLVFTAKVSLAIFTAAFAYYLFTHSRTMPANSQLFIGAAESTKEFFISTLKSLIGRFQPVVIA